MRCISLDGEWELFYAPQAERRISHPDELEAAGLSHVAARVPGNVELDLQRAGVIPDPFYADNIRLLRPFEYCEWWYAREFEAPEGPPLQRWDLTFDGLDTLATVWLNGVEVGRAANMLIEHRFDVTDALRPGRLNRIAVRLESALDYARRQSFDASCMSWEGRDECQPVRKPAHMWGWDIMPRAVSAGIWRSVRLEERPPDAIEQLYYWTMAVDGKGALLGVKYQFRTAAPTLEGLSLQFHGTCGEHSFSREWPAEFVAGTCRIRVPDARLWWPRGYGEPNLYAVTARLCRDGDVLAERIDRIGLRTVVLDRTGTVAPRPPQGKPDAGPARLDTPPDPAGHFVFYVNGEPIMIKGPNWVPLDPFHSRDGERLGGAIALLDDLGCTMVRCWGGNVYEDHPFFDLCDEKGILVWQDFAFACNRYPQTEGFLSQVRAEIESVVRKLRNHPSLAVWCGDNEIDAAYVSDGLSPESNRLTREVIPRAVHRCDPYRHYVPSSPYIPPEAWRRGEAERTPEQHLWGPRGYFKAPFYTDHTAHFIGEIGYHGCPNVSSIKRFVSPGSLWPWQDNDEWQVHSVYHWQHTAVRRDRIGLMANQVRELFGSVPDDLESFALASQITQAEANKFFIESTRLRKWHASGILWWNVLDGWPQFSDAVVDYYFAKKLAYHYIRRVQKPVCVMIGEPDAEGRAPLVVCNDSRDSAHVEYLVLDADTGEAVAGGAFEAPPNQNWRVDLIQTGPGPERLFLITWEADGEECGNHYLAGQRPWRLERYRAWLPVIAALPRPFDAGAVAR